jgi:hypothetical protein
MVVLSLSKAFKLFANKAHTINKTKTIPQIQHDKKIFI